MYRNKNYDRNDAMGSGLENPAYNIDFVKTVEKYPCLWNYTLPEYSKRKFAEVAWKEVAFEIGDTATNCRDRWRNIRGAFLRSLKNIPNVSDAGSKRTYYLKDYLQFVRPYLRCKDGSEIPETSGCSDHFDDTNSDFDEQIENEELLESETQHDDLPVLTYFNDTVNSKDSNTQESNTDKSSVHKLKKRKLHSLETSLNGIDRSLIEWFENKRAKENNLEDSNMSFFRSLLPDISKMTDRQNRRFRQKVIGLIDDILEDVGVPTHYPSISNTNSVSLFRNYPTPSPSNYVNTSMSSPKYLTSPNANESTQDAVQNPNGWLMKNEGDDSNL